MLLGPPFALGYPSDSAQSAYYPSEERITKKEIARVSDFLQDKKIELENTRLRMVSEVNGRASLV
jgi:dipeptidyl-peptidase-3